MLDRHAATLEALSEVTYVGADQGLAMTYYQAQLMIFFTGLTTFMHALALMRAAGVSPEEFLPFAQETFTQLGSDGPMGFAKIIATEVAAGVHPGEDNTMQMQAIGMGHVVETLEEAGLETTVPRAVHALFDRAVAEGRGDEGISTVIQSIRKP
ncbi:hypothetical protein E1295_39400 [Nonomuraea mesophila]|uniref:NADPH-dependent reductive aminase-like C-terminal domain-containing protein n=1 Tax=Nonomuraea mesophila TaxID=2530382 RepID=A0A4R5EEG6_9ACTN|nr:hypothetical protein [Nonomuraea mesophila]TDE32594.1 hypothetical protein E1295_39400 [Nonomuraea mesophila]